MARMTQLDASARLELRKELRHYQVDPDEVRRYRLYALDMLADGRSEVPVEHHHDPDAGDLDPDELEEYMHFLADSLGPALIKFVQAGT